MDRRTLTKLIAVAVLVLGYIVIAAFGFHQDIIAPLIVVGVVVVLFVPFRSKKPAEAEAKRSSAAAGSPEN